MNCRKAHKKDLESLVTLFEDYRKFYHKNPDQKQAHLFLSERLELKDSEIFVCENSNLELVGFVQLYPIFSSTRMKKMWLLNDLFVSKKHRGKGISIQLIDKSKQLAIDTKACGLLLETGKDNSIGNKLYPKTGFILNQEANFYQWSV